MTDYHQLENLDLVARYVPSRDALAISYDNDCQYWTEAHNMITGKVSNVPAGVPPPAIRAGDTIPDEKLSSLYGAAQSMSSIRGRPDLTGISDLLADG